MAIELETKQIEVKVVRRTALVQIFTGYQTDYTMEVFRETVYLRTDTGEVVKREKDAQPIRKKVSDFSPEDPALQVAAMISALADEWDLEPKEPIFLPDVPIQEPIVEPNEDYTQANSV